MDLDSLLDPIFEAILDTMTWEDVEHEQGRIYLEDAERCFVGIDFRVEKGWEPERWKHFYSKGKEYTNPCYEVEI